MKVTNKRYNLSRILKSTAKRWDVKTEVACQELYYTIPEKHGTGSMRAFDFEDGLQCFILDGQLNEPLEWHFHMESDSPFLMFFVVTGKIELGFAKKENNLTINPLQTIFVAHPPGGKQWLKIEPEEHTLFLMLKIEREVYIDHIDCFSEPVAQELASIFSGETTIKAFRNHSDFGLQGAGFLQEVLADKQEGLTHATFAEAKVLDLFSLQLRRWEAEVNSPSEPLNYRSEDVEKLNKARSLLVKDLQNAPTIEELAKQCGLNRQKLKQGFKKMFGRTINEFLRNERLRMSRQMLSLSQPIIKEVASKVGYENASYFARRFKEKYGLYPSEYMKILYERSEEEE